MTSLWFLVSNGMDEDISNIEEFTKLASCLGCDKVEPDDIMECLNDCTIERQSDIHLGNIHADMVLSRIKAALLKQQPKLDIEFYINALDTHLTIDGQNVTDYWSEVVPILATYEDPDEVHDG